MYCVPASTVVLEECVDVESEVREAAMVGLDRPGKAAAGGRRMYGRGELEVEYMYDPLRDDCCE